MNAYRKYNVPEPDWHDPGSMRSNLLVTFGRRAGEMAPQWFISLPGGVGGEDIVAAAGIDALRQWQKGVPRADTFDEHIERYLLEHFPKEAEP